MSRNQDRATLDFTQARIEAFNNAQGGASRSKKCARVTPSSSKRPASLWQGCAGGRDDHFEVLWWSHRDKWEPVGDLGGVVLPFNEADRSSPKTRWVVWM